MSGAARIAARNLPDAGGKFHAEPTGKGGISARSQAPKLLFVDDEPHIVAGLRRSLSEYPYQIHTATSSELALQKLCEEPFDVIVADECMPGMQGSELLTVIANEFPLTGRILLTGNGTISAAARAINQAGVVRLLLKPCPVTELRDAIELALNLTPFEKRKHGTQRKAYLVSRRDPAAPRSERRAQTATNASPGTATHEVQRREQLTLQRQRQWQANELVLHAQPVVRLGSESLFGYELSTRLQAKAGNTTTVGNFVGTAGRHVPLSSVDRWVVRHVLKVVREHHQSLETSDLTVSLNIAAQSLADPDFVRFLDQELLEAGVAPRVLIELRESALTKSFRKDERLLGQLLALRCYEAGTRLCIDGVTGALWTLPVFRNLPIALAKIDSDTAHNVLTSENALAVVRSAVSWGERAVVPIGATGIDSVAAADRLHALGVRYGQGTVFGAAEPVGLTLTNPHR
jgi:EAL domain-containing protein (putative c-di-GMP-specific phosphodiesterase class I)/DNA-binding NarL/FixJ family response regulator